MEKEKVLTLENVAFYLGLMTENQFFVLEREDGSLTIAYLQGYRLACLPEAVIDAVLHAGEGADPLDIVTEYARENGLLSAPVPAGRV